MAEETTQATSRKPEKSAEQAAARGGERSRAGESRSSERRPSRRPRYPRRRKFCKFCADTSLEIDHKNPDLLRQFVTERFKILPARVTGTCARHQRELTTAVKRARILALLPFTPLHHD